jgi:integrase
MIRVGLMTLKLRKPKKPYPEFPLFPHANGQWAKKIRGKTHYFGAWADPGSAHELFTANYDALKNGRTPEDVGTGLTVAVLAGAFLTIKKSRVQSFEIKPRTLAEYKEVVDKVVTVLGPRRLVETLRPADFEKLRAAFAETHGPYRLAGDIQRTRTMFKFGYEQYDIRVAFGASFKKPSAAAMRQAKRSRMLDAVTINGVLATATPTFRAMILLGINCGFGNSDCAMIKWTDLDLDRGWHNFPRPKTGKDRRCPLWEDTVQALKALDQNSEFVFVTSKGRLWTRRESHDPVSQEFAKLLRLIKCHRPGLGFYSLRHTFQTVGNKSGLTQATSYIMGHMPAMNDMPANYQQLAWDDQLQTVVNHVRDWLLDTDTLDQLSDESSDGCEQAPDESPSETS